MTTSISKPVSSNEIYFWVLRQARMLKGQNKPVEELLRKQLEAGNISRIDARIIWQGLYRTKRTPFDEGGK